MVMDAMDGRTDGIGLDTHGDVVGGVEEEETRLSHRHILWFPLVFAVLRASPEEEEELLCWIKSPPNDSGERHEQAAWVGIEEGEAHCLHIVQFCWSGTWALTNTQSRDTG